MRSSTYFISLLLLTCHLSSHPFLLSFLRDLSTFSQMLTKMNQENRQSVKKLCIQSYHAARGNQVIDTEISEVLHSILENKKRESTGISEVLAGKLPPEVHEIIEFLTHYQKFAELGAVMPKGVLLVGPPGTGKTSIARAIAQLSNAFFVHASGSDFIEVYVGVGPQRIRELFEKARQAISYGGYQSAIIYIDEIDAIGGTRNFETNSEYRNTLNELLHQMDGFTQSNSIIVLASTNNSAVLDPALKRPGRFDRIVEIALPDEEDRKEILKLYCQKIKTNKNDPLLFDELAKATPQFSGADLKNLVNEAAIRAVREKALYVTQKHFEQALQDLRKRRRK